LVADAGVVAREAFIEAGGWKGDEEGDNEVHIKMLNEKT